jgi:hypothetical protein
MDGEYLQFHAQNTGLRLETPFTRAFFKILFHGITLTLVYLGARLDLIFGAQNYMKLSDNQTKI